MFGHIDYLLQNINENDFVVDIGGGTTPLARANKVIDKLSYQDYINAGRNKTGDIKEYFTESDWIVMDFNKAMPLPFEDKSVDFVFCSHTLEDLNNPLWLCDEINRIGKRGYIEVPSRLIESLKGFEISKPYSQNYAGYYHHKWFVELINDEIIFTYKTPLINVVDNVYLTKDEIKDYIKYPFREYTFLGIYWNNNLNFRENIISYEVTGIVNELLEFKQRCIEALKNFSMCQEEVTSGIWGTYIIG